MWILFVIVHVNSGSHVVTQEFTSQRTCEEARNKVYSENKRVFFELETAFCVFK